MTEATDELVDRLAPKAAELDCSDYLESIREMVRGPSWADRQIELFKKYGNHREMVRDLVSQARVTEPVATRIPAGA